MDFGALVNGARTLRKMPARCNFVFVDHPPRSAMITRPRFSRALRGLLFAAASIGSVTDCSLEVATNTPSTMVKESGDTQTAAANTQLPVPFTILVVNQFGEILSNVPVSWTITSGGGSLSETSNTTNESGLASVTYTTGPTPGTATIDAKVHGIPPLTFTVTIT